MPRNGSGSYVPPTNAWNPATLGNSATPEAFNELLSDITSALSQSVSSDGQTPVTNNIPMANNKLTGLAQGSASGDSLAWEQLFAQGVEADVASAATTDIGAVNSTFLRITGTTTITSFGANYRGPRFIRFASSLTINHNATTLIIPGGANIVVSSGDCMIARPVGTTPSGWAIFAYQRGGVWNYATLGANTYTGAQTLPGNAANALEAVPKQQLDSGLAARVQFSNLGTFTTTSGTFVDVGSIPTWAQRITVLFDLVGTSGSDQVAIQLGTAASFVTSGYQGSSAYIGPSLGSSLATTIGGGGFSLPLTSASATRSGKLTIDRVSGNTWSCTGFIGDTSSGNVIYVAGRRALSDVLTRIRLTTISGSDTFDGGQISVLAEGF